MSAFLDTRARLVRAAEQLLGAQGYSGTGLKQLTVEAEAPWGSLYHFFPAGKAQLAVEAARFAGDFYAQGWRRAFAQAQGPDHAVAAVFAAEARILEGSDFRNGCPIAALTLDMASLDDGLRRACAEAFAAWLAALSEGFQAHGAPPAESEDLALFVLAAIEGAIVLARAARSAAALRAAGARVAEVVRQKAEMWES